VYSLQPRGMATNNMATMSDGADSRAIAKSLEQTERNSAQPPMRLPVVEGKLLQTPPG